MPITPLSQAHLTLLDTCDRKYQYVFFDALSAPATYDQQLATQWGSQFHLLMQQQAMGLPVSAIADADEEMSASMTALAVAAPEVFKNLAEDLAEADSAAAERSLKQSEHRRTLAFDTYLLTVVYDLLVLSPTQGQIFDWKTYQQPPKKDWLQQDWQTRLYLYVLCETTELRPEQISMTYWFVRLGYSSDRSSQKQPSFYRFSYSLDQHRQTDRDLRAIASRLTRMSEQLAFPKVPVGSELCESCAFNVRCDRAATNTPLYDSANMLRAATKISIESVEEIPL